MTCHSGGSVEIHIQPVLPPPRLLVYGVSPTARALVRLGKAMGYTVAVIDRGAEAADFPDADVVLTDAAAASTVAAGAAQATYAVVATQGQWDEEATAAALALDPPAAYLGVMASAKRFGEMRALLSESVQGAAQAAAIDRIKNPAGLDLGATLPEEIALSILAEIVARRRAAATDAPATTAPVTTAPVTATTPASPPPRRMRLAQAVEAPGPGQARDPVCGMMVTMAGAPHRALHDGREYFFCCGGCRARFVAAPAQFLSAIGAP
jgi:xanthine dehydrogenase accessory factor